MKVVMRLTALLACGLAGQAYAQTCSVPLGMNTPANAPIATGTTCSAQDEVMTYCGGIDSAGKPDTIYQIRLPPIGTPNRATQIVITGGAPGFTPSAYLYSASCAAGNGCVQTGDSATPMDLTTVAGGTYFLAVSAANFEASGSCGPFSLTADGVLNEGFPIAERNALVQLYTQTAGSSWTQNTGWLGAPGTECDWYGVTCNPSRTDVVRIALPSNNLVASLQLDISGLAQLETFDVSHNSLSGTAPTPSGNLASHPAQSSLCPNMLTPAGGLPDVIDAVWNLAVNGSTSQAWWAPVQPGDTQGCELVIFKNGFE